MKTMCHTSCALAIMVCAVVGTVGAAAGGPSGLHWQPLGEPGSGGWITALAISPHDSSHILIGGDVLGIGYSEDRGVSWQVSTGLKSWEIGDITWHPTDPRTAWAGTMSGPYVTHDGGRTWQERRRGMPAVADWMFTAPIEKVLFDPHDERHLLAMGGSNRRMTSLGEPAWGAVWESRDGGETWTRLSTLTVNGKGRNIVAAAFRPGSSQVVYAAADQAGLFVSSDGGKSWKSSGAGLPSGNIERIGVHAAEKNSLWVVLGNYRQPGAEKFAPGGLFKSSDGGATFVSLSGGLNASSDANENFTARYKGFAISASNPRVMILGETTWNHPCVWRTEDGGRSWRVAAFQKRPGGLETAYPVGPSTTVAAIDPRDTEICYAGGSEYMLQSSDGGQTWSDLTASKVGSDAWRGRGFSGLCSINIKFDPHKTGHVILNAMDAGKLWESSDGMKSWRFHGQQPWPWGGGNDVTFASDSHIYATTGQFGANAGILRTTDGKNWNAITGKEHGLPPFEGGGVATGIHALPAEPARVWAVAAGRLYASSDAGEHWKVQHEGPGLGWIAADPAKPERFYVSGAKSVYVTEDGRTFRPVGGPRVAGRMACDSLGRLYVAAYRGERGGLWRFDPAKTDLEKLGSAKWERLLSDGMISNVAIDPTDPDRIAVITNDDPYHDVCHSRGVLISADGGRTWLQASAGLGMLRGWAIAFNPYDPEEIVCGTQGRGYFVARWARDYRPKGDEKYVSTVEDARYGAALPKEGGRPIQLVVRNGGMTQGLSIPAGWNGKFGDCEAARDTHVFKVGPASLRVEVHAGKSGQAFQSFECKGGELFKLAGWVKSSGKVKVNVAVQSFDDQWTKNHFDQVKFVQDDTDWTAFEKQVTVPDWAARFNILLMAEGEGRAWLDEVHDASLPVDPGQSVDPLVSEPPAKAKPCEPGWGFFPNVPQAWQLMHKGFVERARRGNIDVVFFGDSITQGWNDSGKAAWQKNYEPLSAVNFGIGGDSTRQVLWRIEHGEIEGLSPKLVVLAIGTNNLYGDQNSGTDEEIADGIATVVKTLREKLPKTKILVVAILPRQNEYFCSRIRKINAMTAKLDDGRMVRFLDMHASFEATANTVKRDLYCPDELHLVSKGYEVWAAAMRPLFDEILSIPAP